MMAGKGPMRRTTSLTEFTQPDVLASVVEEEEEEEQVEEAVSTTAAGQRGTGGAGDERLDWLAAYGGAAGADDWLEAYRARAAQSRKKVGGVRRNSADCAAAETAAFLRACGLCRRRLGPGRDTFMYKGEAAFCSLECRQQHITKEEWKDKCAAKSMEASAAAAPVPGSGTRSRSSKSSGAGGTVAAA